MATDIGADRMLRIITARPDVQDAIAQRFPSLVPFSGLLCHPGFVEQLMLTCATTGHTHDLTMTVLHRLIVEAATPLAAVEEAISPAQSDVDDDELRTFTSTCMGNLATNEPNPSLVCAVDASHKGKIGFFYKAWVCVACKCFFYRHVRDERNGLPVDKQSDPERFEECLQVGMDPSMVLIRADCKRQRRMHERRVAPSDAVNAKAPKRHLASLAVAQAIDEPLLRTESCASFPNLKVSTSVFHMPFGGDIDDPTATDHRLLNLLADVSTMSTSAST